MWFKSFAIGDYIGQIINICNEKRGHQVDLTYTDNKALLIYKLPLAEVVFDFLKALLATIKSIPIETLPTKKL